MSLIRDALGKIGVALVCLGLCPPAMGSLPDGVSTLAGTYFTIEGNQAGARLGEGLVGGGDFNADGFPDVAMVAPGAGQVYVVFGGGGRLSNRGGVSTNLSIAYDLAFSLSGSVIEGLPVGLAFTDLDRDGFDDLIIGEPSFGGDERGQVYVVYGSNDWDDEPSPVSLANSGGENLLIITSDEPGSQLGYALAGGQNLNSDRGTIIDDLVIGAPGADEVYVIHGISERPSNLQGTQSLEALLSEGGGSTIFGPVNSRLGAALAVSKDFLEPDITVGALSLGAPGSRGAGSIDGCGSVYVLFSPFDAEVDASTQFNKYLGQCSANPSHLGAALAVADWVADEVGYPDLLFSAPLASLGGEDDGTGWLFLRPGGPTGLSTKAPTLGVSGSPAYEGSPDEEVAASIGSADIDGDGWADALIGSTGNVYAGRWASESGQVYVYLSSRGGLPDGISELSDLDSVHGVLTGSQLGEQTGSAVAGVGDLFHSGYEAFVVGAPRADGGGVDAGRVYFYQAYASVDHDGDGKSITQGDCDESRADVYLGNNEGPETCSDGIDQDCSGSDLDCDRVDNDGDGFTELQRDCDDDNDEIFPGADEVCDEVDNDCDGEVDEGVSTAYYEDEDSDGFGNDESVLEACEAPEGYSIEGGDCLDTVPGAYPGAIEVCNLLDDDCDDEIDEGVKTTWYEDGDGDGFGLESSPLISCSQPNGFVAEAGDCDDDDETKNPETLWFPDQDADSYGDDAGGVAQCEPPGDAYILVAGDCNDSEALIFPGAEERCDREDSDCDGVIPPDEVTNADGDGAVLCQEAACEDVGILNPDDDPDVYPGKGEVCLDEKDNDCDGTVDEGEEQTYYEDGDGDGFGDPSGEISACGQPQGYVEDNTDCDDEDAEVYPGGTEIPGDGKDNDCDPLTLDSDFDGDGVLGVAQGGEDCDDEDALIYPGADERCNGDDDDCDTVIDEGLTRSIYVDLDGDTYGNVEDSLESCDDVLGYVVDGSDCDDSDGDINPGATEICGDGVDNDCDDRTDDDCSTEPGEGCDCEGEGDGSGTPALFLMLFVGARGRRRLKER